ncbi:MAG: FAD-linked oxidase C-terminal domain-containing protein [Bacteroidota bacterium]
MIHHLQRLSHALDGELRFDPLDQILYATDASVYRELPLAVALPRHEEDIRKLIQFANTHKVSLIPRSAGTSLAGQCVGSGLVVDVSKYMNRILEINPEEGWVRVQPGVIRDELNEALRPHGLFFGPNTSTANRCMIGGMVGNNSCGSTSIVYGSTREHVLELRTVLSDSEVVTFGPESREQFLQNAKGTGRKAQIYQQIAATLGDAHKREQIRLAFPQPDIHRRNTGYALDILMQSEPFDEGPTPFNFSKLLCGSEGTLAFTTEIKLQLDPLPAPEGVVLAAHFTSVQESLLAVQVAMSHQPFACELMDKVILDCTKGHREYEKYRFFLEGDPQAVLALEFRADTQAEARAQADRLVADLQNRQLGYAHPLVFPPDTGKVWSLRKAGLGLLANIPGDAKAVACIEDTAVTIADLPTYIEEFSEMMEGFGQKAVYYAHAGAGELHLRPILDLKQGKDRQLFHDISEASARLVKKYRGSLSGEHGDGRVRAEFLPMMVGAENYDLFRQLKDCWDPDHLFNPGKIVDAPPMNEDLRYEADMATPDIETVLDFSATGGILRAAEKCNGSGDCRKLPQAGGTMCPSYQATRDEKDTTRGRANVLREMLTRSTQSNRFFHPELKEVMDLCIGCKGCTSECPSNVDMASLKIEFLHQYYQSTRRPLSDHLVGNIASINAWGSLLPGLTNYFLSARWSSGLLKRFLGIAPQRSLPLLGHTTLRGWWSRFRSAAPRPARSLGKVYVFCDEFTNYNDLEVGQESLQLLWHLGYEVCMVQHAASGRAQLSKGLLLQAKGLANRNVRTFSELMSPDDVLLGIEPSAILSFRDEYPRLVEEPLRESARALAKQCWMIDEFLVEEFRQGRWTADLFDAKPRHIHLHGHCHQKALASVEDAAFLLGIPDGHTVQVIPSGCCGMAGSFGYEEKHYAVSQQIGELVLFPAVRRAAAEDWIAAPGTSCRHQILDGTKRAALHPLQILWRALRK